MYNWDREKGMGTLGCVCGDLGLGDIKYAKWNTETSGTGDTGSQIQGCGDVKYRDTGFE